MSTTLHFEYYSNTQNAKFKKIQRKKIKALKNVE